MNLNSKELTNFDTIAQRNFNDNYSSYINKNVASIATKIVIAAVAAQAISSTFQKRDSGIVGALGELAAGIGAGGAVAATVKPDLRSWHTQPAGYAVLRVLLPAGMDNFSVEGAAGGLIVYGAGTGALEILAGKKTFISLRTFKRGIWRRMI